MKLPYRISAAIGLVVILCFLAGAQKPPQFYLKPGQTVDVDKSKLVTAVQNCENWAVAAGLESMLKQQDVTLDQRFWVARISGGEICTSEIPSPENLRRAVNSEFVLDDGRHVRLELQYTSGAPTNTDALIAGLRQNQLSLLLLHGHVFYLSGATYDEYINRDGRRMFIVSELRLANTFAKNPGLAFTKGRDDMEDIQAVIGISVTRL